MQAKSALAAMNTGGGGGGGGAVVASSLGLPLGTAACSGMTPASLVESLKKVRGVRGVRPGGVVKQLGMIKTMGGSIGLVVSKK